MNDESEPTRWRTCLFSTVLIAASGVVTFLAVRALVRWLT